MLTSGTCPKCGSKTYPKEKFCGKCGCKLNTTIPNISNENYSNNNNYNKTKKTDDFSWGLCCLGVIIILVIIYIISRG